jgi:hypothetical protein
VKQTEVLKEFWEFLATGWPMLVFMLILCGITAGITYVLIT